MASGEGTNFSSIVQSIKDKKLIAEVSVLVVNKPFCGARERAKEYDIPCLVIDHTKFKSRESLDNELVKTFEYFQVEGIVMAGWMRIVTNILIDKYQNRILNIHPSLLPSFRGVNAIQQAMEAGVKITGCSVHFVKRSVDSGEIIAQVALPIFENESTDSLRMRVQAQEHKVLPKAIALAGMRWRGS